MKGKLLLSIGLAGLLLALMLGLLALAGPPTARAAGGETFIVDSAGDDPDASPNCQCQTSGGVCTLRAAIQEANACSGPQTIRFSDHWFISPTTALPTLTDAGTVIDGSDRWLSSGGDEYPGVRLYGHFGAFNGLVITASNCAVYGLAIENFGQHGVYLHAGAQNNAIGGTGTHQRNVISANGWNGVRIEGTTTTSNTVAGNYIGTNSTGRYDEHNNWHGVSIWYGAGSVISGNLIASNGWSGVAVDYADRSAEIRNNRIGLSVDGEPLGNGFYGVHIAHGARPRVGFNTIAFNRRGIHIEGGASALISDNTIYSNTASTLTPPRGGGILVTGAGTVAAIDSNQILSNTAHFGGGIAVENNAWADIYGNTIRANRAYTSSGLAAGGGGILVYEASATIEYNKVLSNTVAGAPQVEGGGLWLVNTASTVSSNEIRGNHVDGATGGGGGMCIWGGETWIAENTMVGNASYTAGYGGSAIKVYNAPFLPGTLIDANWIADNLFAHGGAVYIESSNYVSLTNNVVARNVGSGLYLSATANIAAYNNTIARNGESGIYLRDASVGVDNTIVASNTHYGLYVTGTWSLTQWRNNVWGNGLGDSNGDIGFYLETDPLFFGADQYALRAGSPCIDVGNARVATSYNGLPRPQGAGHDLGAYEMAQPTFLPLVLRNS